MKTDKELLELAAKAAGVMGEYRSYYVDAYNKDFFGIAVKGASSCSFWNPLTDDGDALRLAVKLKLDFYVDGKQAGCWINDFVCLVEDINRDPYAATRRAIVRAAADIGEKL